LEVFSRNNDRLMYLDRALGVGDGGALERVEKFWQLVLRVKEAEEFCRYGYEVYGDEWPEHIPRDENGVPVVNQLTWVLFKYRLQLYQAELHYCPIRDRQIMGGGGSGKCLPAGTLITMADGSRVPIETVRVGQRVVTVHPRTLKVGIEDVLAASEQPEKRIVRVRLRNGMELRCSDDHPLLTPGGWVEAGLLRAGDLVVVLAGPHGDLEHVVLVEQTGRERTYDLTVANTHTFLANGIVVHNTEAAAISHAVKVALWPGHDLLWTAPSLEQATLGHDLILSWGEQGLFNEIFVERSVRGQKPEINLRKWDEYDPGGRMSFRSIGSNPVELLRGGTFAFAVADEAMRAFSTDWYIGPLSGRLRGPNRAILNMDPVLSEEYADRIFEVETCYDMTKREKLRRKLEEWVEESGVSKFTTLTIIGNPPRTGRVWWNRLKWGYKHPGERYSRQWSARNNLYLSKDQIRLQEAQFRDRPEEAELEIDAKEVHMQGDVFPYLDTFFDGDLTEVAVRNVVEGKGGWVWETHEMLGVYHYEKPPEADAVYAFALDPGSGIIPRRNKWVLLGCRIDKGPPFEIVYIQTGNMPGAHGTPDPWIAAAQDVLSRYPMIESGFRMEASGTQKDTHYVVWKDDLYLVPVSLSHNLARLIVQAQRTVRADMWWCPDCAMFADEMTDFKMVMDKKAPQDFVSAFLLLNDIVYNSVRDQFESDTDDEPAPEPEEIEYLGREIRMRSREYRGRR